jgi:hypothetical protein
VQFVSVDVGLLFCYVAYNINCIGRWLSLDDAPPRVRLLSCCCLLSTQLGRRGRGHASSEDGQRPSSKDLPRRTTQRRTTSFRTTVLLRRDVAASQWLAAFFYCVAGRESSCPG